MHSPALALTAVACLGALVAAAPATARTKKKRIPSSATYMVTFKAQMDEKWQYLADYADDCKLTGAMCTRVEKGNGSAAIQLKSRHPFPMLVAKGYRGRPPMLNTGTDGVPITGSSLRMGSLTEDYGGPWAGANPDTEQPTSGCGNRSVSDAVTFMWTARNRLAPVTTVDGYRDDCPDGPPDALTWAGGESPSLIDLVATVDQKKFLATKQFTVHGTRKWTGLVTPFSREDASGHYFIHGDKSVTWQWQATFRMKTKRR
jgi:hypothetical protein